MQKYADTCTTNLPGVGVMTTDFLTIDSFTQETFERHREEAVVLLPNGRASFFRCLQLIMVRPVDASAAEVDVVTEEAKVNESESFRGHTSRLWQRLRAGAACASRCMKGESATRDVGRSTSAIVAHQRRRREMTCAQVVKCSFCLPADDQRGFHCCSSL